MPRAAVLERTRLAGSAVLLALLASCALAPQRDPRPVVRGPLASRNLHPLSLALIAFRPRRAAVEAEGEWHVAADVAYASIEEVAPPDELESTSGREFASFDGELARFDVRARYGLGGGFDAEFELPFLYTTSGFLDHFIESFHSAFALPDGGRDLEGNDLFDMEIRSDGDLLFGVDEDRFGVEDVPIYLTRALREEDDDGPGVAARVGLELPTGDEEAGFGNGAVDWGFGVVVEKSLGRWTLFSGADYSIPGDPPGFEAAGKHVEDLFAAQLGAEFRWSDSFSLLFQSTWTSRLVDSPLEEIGKEILDVGFGFAVDTSARSRLAFSIHDDAVSASGPDITALLSWSVDW